MPTRYDPRSRLTGSPSGALVSSWTRLGAVKSVQRGTIALNGAVTSNTLTITAVDIKNAVIRLVSSDYDTAADNESSYYVRLDPTNATTITATRAVSTGVVVVDVEITEYYVGVLRSVQYGTIVANGTGTVTAVVTTKAELQSLGLTTDTGTPTRNRTQLVVTNTTTITATRTDNAGTVTIGFVLVERW